MMEVNGETYRVAYDDAANVVTFEGTLRLHGMVEYDPIKELLDQAICTRSEAITLNLKELRFLNSAGITLLFQFALKLREQAMDRIVVLGAADIPWQGRSLPNLEKLVPGLQLLME
jgi:hypothetical protein